jgi:hypothetical protein
MVWRSPHSWSRGSSPKDTSRLCRLTDGQSAELQCRLTLEECASCWHVAIKCAWGPVLASDWLLVRLQQPGSCCLWGCAVMPRTARPGTLYIVKTAVTRESERQLSWRPVAAFVRKYVRIRSSLNTVLQCLATGWTTGRSRFDPRQRQKDFSSNLCVQTGSGAHPASCTIGTGGPFPGAWRWPLTHLAPRSRMSRSYTSPPKRLRGV